jgi:hypothetical protein
MYEEEKMKSPDGDAPKRVFLNIPHAAELAGFSTRHFRRIIEEERIRTLQIGRKFFILGADFERWQSAAKQSAAVRGFRELPLTNVSSL